MVETGRSEKGAMGSRSHGAAKILFVGGRSTALAADLEPAAQVMALRLEHGAADSASEALEALAQSDAALAVVDMTVDGMRGAEGWRRTREVWDRPIVVVCAGDDDGCAQAAFADGAEDVVRHDEPSASVLLRHAIARAVWRARSVRPEVELRNLRERWESLGGASHWYVMQIDGEDRITYLSRSATAAAPGTFCGKSVFAFTHPDAHAHVRGRLEHVRRTGEAVTVEERGHGTVGDDAWFVARCLPVKRDGQVTSILVVTEDVSERHRMQQLVARSERRFRALIEKSSDAIVLLDPQGHALYASPATAQLLGFGLEELVGRDFKALVHPDDAQGVADGWSSLHETPGGHASSDVRLRHKDGTWRLVQGTATNLLDDPAVGAVVCNCHDVTAQRALEEQVRRAQQWEAIGLLAGGIAHDFNNLLCVIQTAASAAATPMGDGPPDASALEDINQAAGRAAELTRKLLTLSRQQPLAMEYLDAGDLVADFASLMLRALGEDIEVVVSCEPPLPVRVDRLQIEQVLLNVCTNARHAIQGRGRVRIESRRRQLPASGEHVVEIAIHDDGPGMDEATRRRVFDPFFTTKREGSGLGLTVSYGIVQRHGGTMSIDSQPGHGTVVTVRLPVHEGPRSERPARAPRPTATTGAVRILVAEDEPSLRRLFCKVLRAEGYDIVEAEDGDAAVAKVAADPGRIALAVLDVRLPGRSGPAAYEQMLRQRADLPALFVTGHAPDSEAIPRGSMLLVKPFTSDALLRAIASARGVASGRARA
jgi:PAS domain S-box-containing protein